MDIKTFEKIRPSIPHEPGVYQYIDESGVVLYVGKAKNLVKRVSQYFVDNRQTASRIKLMIKLTHRIEWVVVPNENDALILENSLIKEHQPKYNIRLKDDKSYPFVVIKNEPFPRVFFTRRYIKDGSEYLGPYTSIVFAREVFMTIKSLFPLRTCTLNLSPEKIAQGKYKECLEYHIGNCKAPCVGRQSLDDYMNSIARVRDILKGKFGELRSYMESNMEHSAENLQFEEAERWKQRILKLKDFETKSVIFNPQLHHIAAVNIYTSAERKVLNYLKIENGVIVATRSFVVETKLDESDVEIYEHFLSDFLMSNREVREVLLPMEIHSVSSNVRMTIPLLGDKKKLLDLCYINARSYAMSLVVDPKYQKRKKEFDVLKELQDKLHLTTLPHHIECFDNSNLQGTNPVSACVVFKGGKPSKKDYRHFHIKTVEGPDDFSSMREVVYRRYKRMIEEAEPLPNLIVIDGGKGQLSSALESLHELGIEDQVPIIGIAKRLEEIYFRRDPIPLYLDKKSPALKLIQQMRDEAHRFGLGFHRDVRSKKMTKSLLQEISGIGPKTIETLYQKYKSIEEMKAAQIEEIQQLIGKSKSEILINFLNEKLKN